MTELAQTEIFPAALFSYDFHFRKPPEPSPAPIKEPPDPPEGPDAPVREPDPEEPAQM